MRTAVVTDSNSGISPQEAAKMGVYVVPMPIVIQEVSYYEGVNITQEEFLAAQSSGRQVTSSQPSPESVTAVWDQALAEYGELVYLPMSSGLSGSCESAKGFSEESDYAGKVHVVDNHRISFTQKVAVSQALALAKEGKGAAEIKAFLEADAYSCSIYIAVNTLEYLKRSGRVTAAGAALGTVLNIKPILTIQGEKLDAYAKVRGMKRCEQCMIEALGKELSTRFSETAGRGRLLGTAGTFVDPQDAQQWEAKVQAAFPDERVVYVPLPLSIACHVGPNAMGIGVALL